MHLKKLVDKHFVAASTQPQQKMKMYKCIFCTQIYARHVSRMARHLVSKCRGCPQEIKDQVRRKIKPKEDRKMKACEHRLTDSDSDMDIIANSDSNSTAAEGANKENELPAGSSMESHSSSIKEKQSRVNGPSKIKSFCDTMAKPDIDKGQKLLAKAIYSSGTPLCITENTHWQKFLTFLRPAFPLPSRKLLSDKYLEDTYQEVKCDVDKKVAAAPCVGLQCDGWSNVRNEGIMNIILTTPEPVFFKSIPTGTNSETGEYIAQEISKVIDEVGPSKVLAVCTDNAAAMKAAWRKVEEKYKMYNLVFYGCAAHILNLLIKDIMKQTSIQRVTNSVKSLVREIKESHILSGTLVTIQAKDSGNTKTTLKLPVLTRWGSVVTSLKSVSENKYNLQALAIDQTVANKLQRLTKTLLLDEEFWIQVEKTLKFIEPVALWITSLEGDTPKLSSVPEAFRFLKQHFSDVLECALSPLLRDESNAIFAALQARRQMAVTPIHLAASILDPAYRGKSLSEEEHITGTVLIHKLAQRFGLNVDKTLAEIADYMSNEGLWQHQYVQQAASSTTAVKWWKGICRTTCLSKVAQEILNLPATSAATERSFSTHGWIHNAKRNRLTASRAAKIVYISYNSRLDQGRGRKEISPESESEESDLELTSGTECDYADVEYLNSE